MTTELLAPAPANPVALYLARQGSDHGRRTQAGALVKAAEILSGGRMTVDVLPWTALRYEQLIGLRAHLAARYAPAYGARILCAVRGVLREAWKTGLLETDPYYRAIAVPGIKGDRLPKGRALSADELAALFTAIRRDRSLKGVRDLALVGIMFTAGLRSTELARLQRSGCTEGTVLRFVGKGNRERAVPIPQTTGAVLVEWIALSGRVLGLTDGPVFLTFTVMGELQARALRPDAVFDILGRRVRDAGIAHCAPHDLRRTYATTLLAKGARLEVVARLMGHLNPKTTALYDKSGATAEAAAANLLEVP